MKKHMIQYAMMQAFGSGVRAVVAAVQSGGPAVILPKIGRGPITDPLPDLTEGQVREEIWSRCQAHLSNMQEAIEAIGNVLSERTRLDDEY